MGVDVNPQEKTGHHLSPKEFKKMMSEKCLYLQHFHFDEKTLKYINNYDDVIKEIVTSSNIFVFKLVHTCHR